MPVPLVWYRYGRQQRRMEHVTAGEVHVSASGEAGPGGAQAAVACGAGMAARLQKQAAQSTEYLYVYQAAEPAERQEKLQRLVGCRVRGADFDFAGPPAARSAPRLLLSP
eukprot:gene4818-340_t